jgi:uncharacterized protein GlcG (DUF336 family)
LFTEEHEDNYNTNNEDTNTSSSPPTPQYLSTGSPTKIMQLDNMCSISNLAMFPGGVTIKDASGRIVGGVGVSGATGDQDEELALLGSEAYKELE